MLPSAVLPDQNTRSPGDVVDTRATSPILLGWIGHDTRHDNEHDQRRELTGATLSGGSCGPNLTYLAERVGQPANHGLWEKLGQLAREVEADGSVGPPP